MAEHADAPAGTGERLRHGIGIGFAGALAAFGVYFTVTAIGLGIAAPGNPIGPGATPAVLGVLLFAGASTIAVSDIRGLLRSRGTRVPPTKPEEAERRPDDAAGGGRDLLRAVMVLACLGAGLALTPLIGMVLGLTLAVMAICAVVERLSPLRVLLVGASAGALLWLVFGVLLSVNFPDSLIGL